MPRDTKKIARDVVAELAPDELDLFEQIWAEHVQNPALLTAEGGKSERHLGAGLEFTMASLTTLVLIPVIVGVAKDMATKGVKDVIQYVKHRLTGKDDPGGRPTGLSEEEIDRIARAIAKRFPPHEDSR